MWTLSALGQAVLPPRIEWQRTFGGTNEDWPYCIVQTPDGGCIVAGDSFSGRTGNKDSDNYGGRDGWVLRLDARGNKLWEANLGGTGHEMLFSVQNTVDGGFILAGESSSPPSGNKTSPFFGNTDFWVVRLDADGNKVWDKSFGGSHTDRAFTVAPTSDGGFLVGGVSYSLADGNKTAPPFLDPAVTGLAQDYWVVRLDAAGNKMWDKTYGGFWWDTLVDARQTPDNGFILAGFSDSAADGNKTSTNFSMSPDFWVVRTDGSGNMLWDKSFGGVGADQAVKIIVTDDGGFLVGGTTLSDIGGNKSTPFFGGSWDYWVVRLDADGNKLWDQDLGGEGWDLIGGIHQTPDGGFVLSGNSKSLPSGNKTSPLLYWSDLWVVRLDRDGTKLWEQSYNGTHAVGTVTLCPAKDGGYFLSAGAEATTVADFLIAKLSPDPLVVPRLEFPVRGANDLRFMLSGISNRVYVTEFSSDLQTWSPLATNQLTSAATEIVDSALGSSKRFYRARMLE